MRTLKKTVSSGVVGLLLAAGAQAAEPPASDASTGVNPAPSRQSKGSKNAEAPKPDASVVRPVRKIEQPETAIGVGREIAEEVKQVRLDFLKERQELKKRSMEAQRAQIRAKLKENRPGAPAMQPPTVTDLRDKLQNHKEVLEAASSVTREQARKRRDGD
jgi:hypothetical protein